MNGENSNDTVITESTMNVNVKQELFHHEQGNAATVSSAQSDGRSSVMSLPNIPCITKQQIEDRSERFFGIRNGVEDKSRQLSDVWSELYNLLGQYKSELFSVEVANQSFNGMDSGQLKQEVLQRDNVIYERDSEISELRSQLEQLQQHIEELQNHSEQCRLDVDTKDRLINQYQQDLMEKDTQLLTANTKVGRLENRLKMLEARVPQPMPQSPVPRKVVRTPQSMRGMAMSPVRGRGRASPMGLGSAGRLAQAGVGRFSPAARMGPGAQQMRRRPVQQQQAIRRPAQPHLVPPPAVMPTPISQPSAVVCIEVDDDDDQSQDVKPNIPTNQTTPNSNNSPMKTESKEIVQSYLESMSRENNSAQGQDMKPGFSEHFDINQPMMSQDLNFDQDGSWLGSVGEMMTSQSGSGIQAGGSMDGSPSKVVQVAAAILRAAGHTVQMNKLQTSGPLLLRHTPIQLMRAAYCLLQESGLGTIADKGMFMKSAPYDVTEQQLRMFGLSVDIYNNAYSKKVNKKVANYLGTTIIR